MKQTSTTYYLPLPFGIVLLLLFPFIGYCQEEGASKSEVELRDGLYKAEVGLTTKLSERWTLHNNVSLSYNDDANSFVLPVLLRFKLTDEVSFYGGFKAYRVANTPRFNSIAPVSKLGVGSLMGLSIDVTDRLFFKAQYDANFSMDQNSQLLGLENNRSGGSFHFGYSF